MKNKEKNIYIKEISKLLSHRWAIYHNINSLKTGECTIQEFMYTIEKISVDMEFHLFNLNDMINEKKPTYLKGRYEITILNEDNE